MRYATILVRGAAFAAIGGLLVVWPASVLAGGKKAKQAAIAPAAKAVEQAGSDVAKDGEPRAATAAVRSDASVRRASAQAGPAASVVDEITAIRDNLSQAGGAVGEVGIALPLSPQDRAEFRSRLTQLIEQGSKPGFLEAASSGAGAASSLRRSEESPGISPADDDQELARSLRAISRQLEMRASDLEDAGEYERADRLRCTSDALRQQARELLPAARRGVPTEHRESAIRG